MEQWGSDYSTATSSQLPKHFRHQTYWHLVDTEEYDVHEAIRASRLGYKKEPASTSTRKPTQDRVVPATAQFGHVERK